MPIFRHLLVIFVTVIVIKETDFVKILLNFCKFTILYTIYKNKNIIKWNDLNKNITNNMNFAIHIIVFV